MGPSYEIQLLFSVCLVAGLAMSGMAAARSGDRRAAGSFGLAAIGAVAAALGPLLPLGGWRSGDWSEWPLTVFGLVALVAGIGTLRPASPAAVDLLGPAEPEDRERRRARLCIGFGLGGLLGLVVLLLTFLALSGELLPLHRPDTSIPLLLFGLVPGASAGGHIALRCPRAGFDRPVMGRALRLGALHGALWPSAAFVALAYWFEGSNRSLSGKWLDGDWTPIVHAVRDTTLIGGAAGALGGLLMLACYCALRHPRQGRGMPARPLPPIAEPAAGRD
jgi:hypothetical protein